MNQCKNLIRDWRDEEALRRYQFIAPVLDPNLDEAAKAQKREEAADAAGLSVRTLYRYEKGYRDHGFEGLKPADRKGMTSKRLPENFDVLFADAVQLKKEVPKRSVSQIIEILELEGKVPPGVLKRSTLEDHLYEAGFGVRQMKVLNEARESSSRRFCKPHRMMLIQGDIKYGPKLPIGKNGKKVQTYLSSAIDDHSRHVLHSCFYDNQSEAIVEDTFRKTLIRAGKFDACYFDRGSQYIARQLKLSLAKLGIPVRHAPVRSGKSKGKIEKFHQVVDSFLREAKLKKYKTLEELNRAWAIYLEEQYEKSPHDGIAEYYESLGTKIPDTGITPLQEFNRDQRPLTFIDLSVIGEAFLHHEKRRVDKGGCISFDGKKYETKPELIGFNVEISYDPAKRTELTVSYPGIEPFMAKPLEIRSFIGRPSTLPVSMKEKEPETSRLLDALEKKHREAAAAMEGAISFTAIRKEVDGNV